MHPESGALELEMRSDNEVEDGSSRDLSSMFGHSNYIEFQPLEVALCQISIDFCYLQFFTHVLDAGPIPRTGATVVETEPVVDGRLRYQLLNGSGPSTGWVTVQVSCRTFVGQMARTPRNPHPKNIEKSYVFHMVSITPKRPRGMVLDDLEKF